METEQSTLQKMFQLEQSLKSFRAEVNMKLNMMEQIFLSRNEQLERQRRLLDREQAFYKSLLQNWKNSVPNCNPDPENNFDDGDNDNFPQSSHGHGQISTPYHFNLKTEVLSGTEGGFGDMDDGWGLNPDSDLGSDPEFRLSGSSSNRRNRKRKRRIQNSLNSRTAPEETDGEQSRDDGGSGSRKSSTFGSPRKSRQRKSYVWNYFEKAENDTYAICSFCNTKLQSVDGSTGGMIQHLRRKHNLTVPSKPASGGQGGSSVGKGADHSISKPSNYKPRAKKSYVWKYFRVIKEENCAVCIFCNNKRSMKDGSTGGMIHHLKKKHFILNQNSTPPATTQIWDYFDKIPGDSTSSEPGGGMCKECLTMIPMPESSNTSCLSEHLKEAHDITTTMFNFNHEDIPDNSNSADELGQTDAEEVEDEEMADDESAELNNSTQN